jgi:hypothetical protein
MFMILLNKTLGDKHTSRSLSHVPFERNFQPLKKKESLAVATLPFSLHLLLVVLSRGQEERDVLSLGLLHLGPFFSRVC